MAINLYSPKVIPKFDPLTAVKQDFPYPSSIMYYIKTCPKHFNFYYKFVKTCKYFYSLTDPIPYNYVASIVHLNPGQKFIMKLFTRDYFVSLNDLKKIKKLWLRGNFLVDSVLLPLPFCSTILKNLYRSDITYLRIYQHSISFKDFQMLISSKLLLRLSLFGKPVIKYDSDGTAVPLDKILRCVPNIKRFMFYFSEEGTPEYVKKIVALLNSQKLRNFALKNIIKPFDFETFSIFMKMNPKISYELEFSDDFPLHRENLEKLQKFVNQIIAAGETENPPPQIFFPGLSVEDKYTLKTLGKKFKNRKMLSKTENCPMF